jgi:hypothetical protein
MSEVKFSLLIHYLNQGNRPIKTNKPKTGVYFPYPFDQNVQEKAGTRSQVIYVGGDYE